MLLFQSRIINVYGDQGKRWLDELAMLVKEIASKLNLKDLKPIANLSYNYVLSGFQSNMPVILKLGLDYESLAKEALALKCFAGLGAVKVIAEEKGILLLERAVPGTSIKNYFPNKDKEAVHITCKVIEKLHQANVSKSHKFPHIKEWLSVLDKEWPIPIAYLQKARKLRDELLASSYSDVLLHGDLHHDNILQNGDEWVIIDAKGVRGESICELFAFLKNPQAVDKTMILKRIDTFAEYFNFSQQRIINWCFVQSVLSWCWDLEDNLPVSSIWITEILDELTQ